MTSATGEHRAMERLLAAVLRYGTWLAAAVIAVGLIRIFAGGPDGAAMAAGTRVVTAGIALFILLPVIRVTLMAIVFALERDYRFVAIATLVLLIIALGLVLGVRRRAPARASHSRYAQAACERLRA